MKNMTLRNIPEELSKALEEEKRRRGQSLNKTAIDLMRQSLGLNGSRRRSNGLGQLAGGWSQSEFEEFEKAVAPFEQIDESCSWINASVFGSVTSKPASTVAEVSPVRMESVSARPPRMRFKALRMIDLPAPVSPVKTLRPG